MPHKWMKPLNTSQKISIPPFEIQPKYKFGCHDYQIYRKFVSTISVEIFKKCTILQKENMMYFFSNQHGGPKKKHRGLQKSCKKIFVYLS